MGAITGSIDDDLATLARVMARLERHAGQARAKLEATGNPIALARTIFEQRRQRTTLFHEIGDLLVEPAWDILLNLYAAPDARGLPASSAGRVAGVPHTTSLRYLATLESRGLIESDTSDEDKRCRYVRLCANARARMTMHLSNAPLTVSTIDPAA